MRKSLDIGCGKNKTADCIGIDRVSLPGVDVVHNLDEFPWPLEENEFDVVYANHYLEHATDPVACIKEVHRILVPGGTFKVRVPHFASDNFYSDLTHKNPFGYRSFDHFSVNGAVNYDFYEDFKYEIVSRRIKFMSPDRRFDPYYLFGIEFLINKIPRIYEKFFAFIFRPAEVMFELRVVK
ncbi:class I SAM-dependent methyltransferase [Aurantivibrio infirmus]